MQKPEIIRRSSASDRAAFDLDFCSLPDRVRRDPYRVGLLTPPMWAEFLALSPAFKAEFWLARAGGRVVARIGANPSAIHSGAGYVGFFEADLSDAAHGEATGALLREACAWLRDRGA